MRGVGGFIVLASYVLVWSWKVPINLSFLNLLLAARGAFAPCVVTLTGRYSVNNLMPERPFVSHLGLFMLQCNARIVSCKNFMMSQRQILSPFSMLHFTGAPQLPVIKYGGNELLFIIFPLSPIHSCTSPTNKWEDDPTPKNESKDATTDPCVDRPDRNDVN